MPPTSCPAAATGSARFEGYLEVPAAGPYRFYVVLDKAGAEAELRFDHLPAPLFNAAATDQGEGALGANRKSTWNSRPGVPYRLHAGVPQAGGRGRAAAGAGRDAAQGWRWRS